MGAFQGLGRALRWLRAREDLKQHELSKAARITKAMLSSYETERQRPSIETLEKILTGLGATLTDLNDALVEVNVRTAQRRAQATIAAKARPGTAPAPPAPEKPSPNLRALPTHQQEAMRQMMAGFQAMMQTMAKSTAPPPEPPKLIRSRKTRR